MPSIQQILSDTFVNQIQLLENALNTKGPDQGATNSYWGCEENLQRGIVNWLGTKGRSLWVGQSQKRRCGMNNTYPGSQIQMPVGSRHVTKCVGK